VATATLLGDLVESQISVTVGIKDMGRILPATAGLMTGWTERLAVRVATWTVLTLCPKVRADEAQLVFEPPPGAAASSSGRPRRGRRVEAVRVGGRGAR